MQCQFCKKHEATIHLTEIVDGKRSEMHLCEYCAAEQNIFVQSTMPVNELLSGLLSNAPDDEELMAPADQERCPDCGFSFEEFRNNSLLGCPNDYKHFAEQIEPLIRRAQNGKSHHCGKVPSNMCGDEKRDIEITRMKKELATAVCSEKYERAAELRDKIAELE
jgi:protein arginine kinase activator